MSYLIVESGQWRLEGGLQISVGHFASDKLSSRGFSRVVLSGFADTPAVLTQVQTSQGGDFVVTRTRRQTAQSFEVTMQEEEQLNRGLHQRETIGWIAISQGTSTSASVTVESGSTARQYSHRGSALQLMSNMESPSLLIKLSSYFGADTANIRVIDNDQSALSIQVMEDSSRDSEKRHTREEVSYLALEGEFGHLVIDPQHSPEEPSSRAFGEYGQVTLTQEWQTLRTQHRYENPVVVLADPSAQGGVAVTARLRAVSAQSFEAKLVSSRSDLNIEPSTVSFMVLEEGEWVSASGAKMLAGHRSSSRLSRRGWESVSFNPLRQNAVALTQVQTNNEGGWLTTRVRRQSRSSFQVAMQEVEATNRGQHAEESIGWIVIEPGDHDLGDARLISATTPRAFTHQPVQLSYGEGFESRTTVIGKLGSSHGGDSSNLSMTEVDGGGFVGIVAEERSRDQELRHISERVSLVALSHTAGVFMTE